MSETTVDVERCEGCGQPTPVDQIRRDVESVPLCPSCWDEEPWVDPESDVHDPVDLGLAAKLMGRKPGEPAPFACCPRCDEPLVSTIEFRGAEFYCVACGGKFGFLAPTPKAPTPELEARHDELREQYRREREARRQAASGDGTGGAA